MGWRTVGSCNESVDLRARLRATDPASQQRGHDVGLNGNWVGGYRRSESVERDGWSERFLEVEEGTESKIHRGAIIKVVSCNKVTVL